MTTQYLHRMLAKIIVLIGFSVFGLICGVFCSIVGSLIGTSYQVLKVLMLIAKTILGNCESHQVVVQQQAEETSIPMIDVSDISHAPSFNTSNLSLNSVR